MKRLLLAAAFFVPACATPPVVEDQILDGECIKATEVIPFFVLQYFMVGKPFIPGSRES